MILKKFVFLLGAALDESLLDALGILPRRKRHKKLLLVCRSRFYSSSFASLCTSSFVNLG
jgi:hypothetical protein